MQPDNLRFFVLAGHVIYAVIIRNPGDRPVLRRVLHDSPHDRPEFANRAIAPGYYISLTGLGLYKHPAADTEDGHCEGDFPPPPGAGLDCRHLGHDTVVIRETVGYFLDYTHVREALHTSSNTPFADPFLEETRSALGMIGYNHPTVRLSTLGKYALPSNVLP